MKENVISALADRKEKLDWIKKKSIRVSGYIFVEKRILNHFRTG